jgi:class 3 adenylate cyclase
VTTETRSLAAILVADVVGFGRLAGADEARPQLARAPEAPNKLLTYRNYGL